MKIRNPGRYAQGYKTWLAVKNGDPGHDAPVRAESGEAGVSQAAIAEFASVAKAERTEREQRDAEAGRVTRWVRRVLGRR